MSEQTLIAIEPESEAEENPAPAYLLAACSAGAGVIHLMMAPVHASASQAESLMFAAAGWFQIGIAALMLFRPARRFVAAAGIGNMLIIAAWVWSRTKGLPIGAHPWEPEEVSGVDLTAALLEGAVVLGALGTLFGSSAARRMPPLLPAVGAVAVVGLTTAVLVNPSTADHHGGASADHHEESTLDVGGAALAATPVATRCDKSLNPVSYWNEAKLAGVDGTSPAAVPAATAAAGGHSHGAAAPAETSAAPAPPTTLGPLKGRGSAAYDNLVKLANQSGELAAGFFITELAKVNDDEYHEFIASLNPANAASGHHTESTGNTSEATSHTMSHLGPQEWKPMSDGADCAAVREELAKTKAVADKYPQAKDAVAAGYRRVAPYLPGIASHWMKFKSLDGVFDINDPEMLLYDGNSEESHIVGVSYYVTFDADSQPSQGFTGDNDHYHRHLGLCNGPGGGVIGDSDTTDEECEARGGRKSNGGSGWMSHAWVVPGCESPWGVFSGTNPLLDQQLGAESGKNGGNCSASAVRDRYDLNPASADTMPAPTTSAPASQQVASGG